MHSARFLLKFRQQQLNHLCLQDFYLQYIKFYPVGIRNFISWTTQKTEQSAGCSYMCDCSTSKIVLSKPFSTDVLQKSETSGILEREVVKSHGSLEYRNRKRRNFPLTKSHNSELPGHFLKGNKNSRKISIATKSNDPDTFGDMEGFQVMEDLEDRVGEESDCHEDSGIFIPEDRKYKSASEYLQGMKALVKEKKLKQALELFADMKRHLVHPIPPHYTFMIGACGRAGYTEMAFKLLRQMTDRGFTPSPATLTGLFNSCAESPDSAYGLRKARSLKDKVALKFWTLAPPTYHAMIKAFGKCGDIETAFQIVDEMKEAGFRITVQTYTTLLFSCISDKEAGFTHVIEVWRKMISKNLRPNIFTYNLLLRAVRDCGIGPEEVSSNLLQHWSSCHPHLLHGRKKALSREDVLPLHAFPYYNVKLISEPASHADTSTEPQEKTTSPQEESNSRSGDVPTANDVTNETVSASVSKNNSPFHIVPNLLLPRPVDGPKFMDLGKVESPFDRLLLIGGLRGILELMRNDNVIPDIKTFTILLRILPDSTEHENELLALMDSYELEVDVDFFNNLIKKRNYRRNFRAAKGVLELIAKKGLHPDIVTFGVLALGCIRKEDGLQLLHDMKTLGFSPNVEIFGALLNSASKNVDFEYICTLMKAMKAEEVKPSPKFLQMLEDVRNVAREKIIAMEQGKEVAEITFSEKSYNQFCQFYEKWLRTTTVEEQLDPLLQYKTEVVDHVQETCYQL